MQLQAIQSFVGTRYDAKVVAAFTEACDDGQIRPGSVKLKKRTPTEPKVAEIPPNQVTEAEALPVG